jgi:hypothetical protein
VNTTKTPPCASCGVPTRPSDGLCYNLACRAWAKGKQRGVGNWPIAFVTPTRYRARNIKTGEIVAFE